VTLFSDAATPLRERGYSTIPLFPREKKPAIDKWSKFCTEQPTDEEFTRWSGWANMGVSVCLGSASGIIAVDFDNNVDDLWKSIVAMLPDSPVKKVGLKGFTGFYKYSGESSKQFKLRGEVVVEILSTGRHTVLPPSTHPSGCKYKWITDLTLANLSANDLPEIPFEAWSAIAALFPSPARHVPVPVEAPANLSDAEDALQYVPNGEYELWLSMGMALKEGFGESGFNTWDKWSSSSDKYNAREMRNKWNSFKRSEITIHSLFFEARTRGWKPVVKKSAPVELHTPADDDLYQAAIDPFAEFRIFPAHLLKAPGLVGMLAQHINATSIYPLPALALGAALTFTGYLMAHKVRTQDNVRTNLMCIGLGETGSGKDHGRSVIKYIMSRIDMPYMGAPASGAGLIQELYAQGGAGIILWDEYGLALQEQKGPRASDHKRKIYDYMLELYTSAKSSFAMPVYANKDFKEKKKSSTSIEQPSLSLWGTSTQTEFFKAITMGNVSSGFIPRLLIFEHPPEERVRMRPAYDEADIPEDLICELVKWARASKVNSESSLSPISPRIVPYDAGVDDYFVSEQMRITSKTARSDAMLANGILPTIATRFEVLARQVALICHTGDSISMATAEYACRLVEYIQLYMAHACTLYVTDGEVESRHKFVYNVIARHRGRWMQHRDFMAAVSFKIGTERDRREILNNLVQMGKIEISNISGRSGVEALQYRVIS
jgi:hypothetical protein